jgi:hypothetical protein
VSAHNENFARPQYARAPRPGRRNGIRPAVTARGRAELEQTLKRSAARVALVRVESSIPPETTVDEWRYRDLAA